MLYCTDDDDDDSEDLGVVCMCGYTRVKRVCVCVWGVYMLTCVCVRSKSGVYF